MRGNIDLVMYFDFIFLMSHGTVRNLGLHAYAGIAFITFLTSVAGKWLR